MFCVLRRARGSGGEGEEERRGVREGRGGRKKKEEQQSVDFFFFFFFFFFFEFRRSINHRSLFLFLLLLFFLLSLSPTLSLPVSPSRIISPKLVRDLAAHDPLGEAREVLDVRRRRQLPSRGDAVGEPALEEDGLELGARGVDRRRVGRGPGADDADGRALGRGGGVGAHCRRGEGGAEG